MLNVSGNRRKKERRDVNQRRRCPLNKKVFVHNIGNKQENKESKIDIYDKKRLKKLRNKKYMIDVFKEDNLLLKEGDNWITTLKHSPYSDKDLMIVYKGNDNNPNIGSFDGKSNDSDELFEILQKLLIGVIEKYSTEFDGNLELCIGNNNTIIPQSGEAQSLYNPHYHFAIFSTIEGIKNNIETLIQTVGKNQNIFPLNRVNLDLIRFLEIHLKIKGFNIKREILLDKSNNLAIDIELKNKDLFLGNKEEILSIYKEINSFHKELNIELINKLMKGLDSEFSHDRISYSISFHLKQGKLIMRIRYSYRNKTKEERGGSMANSLHILNRTEDFLFPDLINFKNLIFKILK